MGNDRRQPRHHVFRRLANHLGLAKAWYKRKVHRASRKKLHQARDIENHQDHRLDPWDLD